MRRPSGRTWILAHFGPNLQFPCTVCGKMNQHNPFSGGCRSPSADGPVAAEKGGVVATYLCKILANRLGGGAQVVAERTCVACLAGALSEEFAGDVCCVCGPKSVMSAHVHQHTPKSQARRRQQRWRAETGGPLRTASHGVEKRSVGRGTATYSGGFGDRQSEPRALHRPRHRSGRSAGGC